MASTLGHLNVQNLHLLSPKDLATSMPNISIENQFCQTCTLGEHDIEKTFKTSLHRMKTQIDLVHTNVYNHFTTTFCLMFTMFLCSLTIIVGLVGFFSQRKI